jgi:hypothetical protein
MLPRLLPPAQERLIVKGALRHRLRCRRQDVRASPVRPSEMTGRTE